jgi:hypothetical protein
MDRAGRVRPEIHLTQSPMPAKSLKVYLQVQGGPGKLYKVTCEFNVGVTFGTTYNIDPAIAHGFIYETGSGDPNFSSVELSNIGNLNDYSLYLWESGKWVFDTLLAPDTIFDFASGGVSEFEIPGINPSGDASNGNAFVTRVSFIGDGTFNGYDSRHSRAFDLGDDAARLRRPRLGRLSRLAKVGSHNKDGALRH